MFDKKKRQPSGPWWKRMLRTVLVAVGTALVVAIVDAVLYPAATAREDGEEQ